MKNQLFTLPESYSNYLPIFPLVVCNDSHTPDDQNTDNSTANFHQT